MLIRIIVAVALLLAPRAVDAAELIFTTQDFAPYHYERYGVVMGPAADVVNRICSEMKIKCSIQMLPWARAQKEVKDGRAQGLFIVAKDEERAKWLYFSPPLLVAEHGFFVRNDNPLVFKQNTDVKGYTVGVFGPSNTATALDKIKAEVKDLAVEMTPRDEAAFKKLSVGRVRAVFSNKDVGHYRLRTLGITNVRYAGRQQALKYYIGFAQKFTDKKLVDQFNETFRMLHHQGVIKELLGRYWLDPAALD